MIGKIIAVSDLSVDILLNDTQSIKVKDILYTKYHDMEYKFEVVSIDEFVAKTMPQLKA